MADAASPANPVPQEVAVLRQRVAMVQEQVERPKRRWSSCVPQRLDKKMRKEHAWPGSASLSPASSYWLHTVSVHSRSSDVLPERQRAPSARTGPNAVCATGHEEEQAAMPRHQARLRAHIMCWACVLALIVSGIGSVTAGPRVAMPDLEKQAATFLRRLGFALQGDVICAAVAIGTQAYVCQALGIPSSPEASLQKAQLLAFYCSPEGVCWFAPERMP